MDDFCAKEQIFLNEDDRIKTKLTKTKDLYQEYKRTVRGAFKHVKKPPEVPGLEVFLSSPKSEDEDTIQSDGHDAENHN